jgi:catalase
VKTLVAAKARSVSAEEQKHMAKALTFELGKVGIADIRRRMLGHLNIIDEKLASLVADGLGMTGEATKIAPAVIPIDLKPSPALRMYGKYPPTLKGRKVGVLLGPGFDAKLKKSVVAAIEKEGARAAIIAPKVGGVEDSTGTKSAADMALGGSPSVLFDAVVVLAGPAGDKALANNPDAVDFLMDASRYLKAIAHAGMPELAAKTQLAGLPGVVELKGPKDTGTFIDFARNGKVWDRDKPSDAK